MEQQRIQLVLMLTVLVLALVVKYAYAQQKTPNPWKTYKQYRVSVTAYRESYSWNLDAYNIEDAKKRVWATLKKLQGKAFTTKTGRVEIYEK